MRSPTLIAERILWNKGFTNVVGIDEAGRGPLAGPVVAGAVILPRDFEIHPFLRDSKKVTEKRRELLYDLLIKEVAYGIGEVSAQEVDLMGIGPANQQAMLRAVENLMKPVDFYLIDHFYLPTINRKIQRGITKGDATVASISAAAIIAKVYRDSLLKKYDEEFPQYGFAQHKGYGTTKHREAIKEHGPSPFHRKTFLTNILS